MKFQIQVTKFKDFKEKAENFYEVCRRKTQLEPEDTLVVALKEQDPIGMVRLCDENGTFVLRTMQIHPEYQRKGIGSVILENFNRLLHERKINEIYCMPYAHLESFYGQIGFQKILTEEAPNFLQLRLKDFFLNKPNEQAILMKRVHSS